MLIGVKSGGLKILLVGVWPFALMKNSLRILPAPPRPYEMQGSEIEWPIVLESL